MCRLSETLDEDEECASSLERTMKVQNGNSRANWDVTKWKCHKKGENELWKSEKFF